MLQGAKSTGIVLFSQSSLGGLVAIDVNINGLKPNSKFGFHVHDKGDLSHGCASLGGHYNPDGLLRQVCFSEIKESTS